MTESTLDEKPWRKWGGSLSLLLSYLLRRSQQRIFSCSVLDARTGYNGSSLQSTSLRLKLRSWFSVRILPGVSRPLTFRQPLWHRPRIKAVCPTLSIEYQNLGFTSGVVPPKACRSRAASELMKESATKETVIRHYCYCLLHPIFRTSSQAENKRAQEHTTIYNILTTCINSRLHAACPSYISIRCQKNPFTTAIPCYSLPSEVKIAHLCIDPFDAW